MRSSYGITAYCPINMLVLAQRVKAYVVSTTPIYQYATTSSYAAGPLSVNTEVYIIGCDSGFYRVQNANGSITGYVPTGCIGPNAIAVKPAIDPRQFVQIYDWYKGGSDLLQKGETGMIYDIWSGQFFNVHRMGGSSHADLEPLTLNDTRNLYSIVGGEYSWESRPVILITSRGFAAAAINTMPHGEQTITTNGFEGQFCLHMINSRTHGSDSINNEHQKAIREAYNWAH